MDERTGGVDALSPGLRRLWGLESGVRRGQRPSLSIEQVLEAGVAVADAEGLDAVSMSRVASEVGFTTMALYRYVASKEELLELMVDVAAGHPPELDEQADWRERLEHWSMALLNLYRAHPWVVDIPVSGPPLSPNQLAWFEKGLQALRSTQLDPVERLEVIMVILGLIRGEMMLERQLANARETAGRSEEDVNVSFGRALSLLIDADRFPELSALASVWEPSRDEDESDVDAPQGVGGFGLERILDGVELLVRKRRRYAARQQ